MKDYIIPEPSCVSCEFLDAKRSGTRYCKHSKKPRLFKSKDPKRKLPAWCPKFKKPPVVRVYGFESETARGTWLVFGMPYDNGKGKNDVAFPRANRYKLDFEGIGSMNAKAFYMAANTEDIENLIDFKIEIGNVIEIDDGIKPYFFYYQGARVTRPATFTPPARTEEKL